MIRLYENISKKAINQLETFIPEIIENRSASKRQEAYQRRTPLFPEEIIQKAQTLKENQTLTYLSPLDLGVNAMLPHSINFEKIRLLTLKSTMHFSSFGDPVFYIIVGN